MSLTVNFVIRKRISVTSVFVKRNFESDILLYFLCASITITFFYNSISIPFFHAILPPVTKSAVIMSLQPVPISTVTWLLADHFTWIPAQSHAFDPSLAWLTPYCLTLNYVYGVAIHLLGAGNEPVGCCRLDAAFFYLNVPLLTQASSEVLRKIRGAKTGAVTVNNTEQISFSVKIYSSRFI